MYVIYRSGTECYESDIMFVCVVYISHFVRYSSQVPRENSIALQRQGSVKCEVSLGLFKSTY